MKFKIGKRIDAPYKDTFVVKITTMEGDADDSHYVYAKIKKEEELAELVTELKRLGYMPFNGLREREEYEKASPILFKYVCLEEWPYDPNSDSLDDLDCFEVFYYNSKHEKFEVSYEKEKEKKSV
jgi:hypothetical protein